MQNLSHLVHAYKVAPWRLHRQWAGNFLLFVVALSMTAALYLDVSAQSAIAGREIQDLTAAMTIHKQTSADLQTRLAALTASTVMEQRALALGFEPVAPEAVAYLIVPGYAVPVPEILASSSSAQLSAPNIPPAYTQSLLEWFEQNANPPFRMGGIP